MRIFRLPGRTWLKLLGLLALLSVVGLRFDWASVQASSRGFSGTQLMALAGLFTLSAAVRIGKWAWQVRQMSLSFRWIPFLRSYLLGLVLGSITPLRVGEFYRIAVLTAREPVPEAGQSRQSVGDPGALVPPKALAAAGLVLEKALEVSVLLVFIALGFWQVLQSQLGVAVVTALLLGSLGVLLTPLQPPTILRRLVPTSIDHKLLTPLLDARDRLDFRARVGLLALTFASHALNLYAGLLIYRGFGPMNAWDFTFRVPVLTLINQLPVTVGGIGLRELSAMEVFGSIGYPASSAALAATLLFMGSNLFPALYLLPLMLVPSQALSAPGETSTPADIGVSQSMNIADSAYPGSRQRTEESP